MKPWRKRAWPRVPLLLPWELDPADRQDSAEAPAGQAAPDAEAGAGAPAPRSGLDPGATRQAAAALASAAAARAARRVDAGGVLSSTELADSVFYWQQQRARKKGSK